MTRFASTAVFLLVAGALAACAPARQSVGPAVTSWELNKTVLVTADGVRLPYRSWAPRGRPKAVIIALHGLNDHSRTFEEAAEAWQRDGFTTYAYDQRGFGGAPKRGLWPGADTLIADLKAMTRLVRKRHPNTPVYLLGVSMGGGVVLGALDDPDLTPVDGAILLAPAVVGRELIPGYLRVAGWIAAHTLPSVHLTSNDLKRVPTDNEAFMRQMSRDPRIIKYLRVDSLYGVTNLMDEALAAAPKVRVPVLLLYGEKDQIIPKQPIEVAIKRLPPKLRRVAIYREGWHLLLNDKQANVVYRDIATWMTDKRAPLPSGADRNGIASTANGSGSKPAGK